MRPQFDPRCPVIEGLVRIAARIELLGAVQAQINEVGGQILGIGPGHRVSKDERDPVPAQQRDEGGVEIARVADFNRVPQVPPAFSPCPGAAGEPMVVAAGERVAAFEPCLPQRASLADLDRAAQGRRLLIDGKDLIFHVTRARVPMPKSTAALIERLQRFAEGCRRSIPVIDDSGRAVVLVSPAAPEPAAPAPPDRVSV